MSTQPAVFALRDVRAKVTPERFRRSHRQIVTADESTAKAADIAGGDQVGHGKMHAGAISRSPSNAGTNAGPTVLAQAGSAH